MEHSPDGKAYLLGMGAEADDPSPRYANLSWISADQIYLARVTPSVESMDDLARYEFFAGHDERGEPTWSSQFEDIEPLLDWNDNMGCVTATYVPPLGKYLMCVTDGWPTVARMSSYVLEADEITGPWRLVTYMKDFGQQAYFLNFPSKFIGEDGRTLWLCYSANFSQNWNDVRLEFDPPGGRYGLCLHELRLLAPGEETPESPPNPLEAVGNLARAARVTASSTYAGYDAKGAVDRVVGGYPGDTAREWASDGETAGAWIRLEWAEPVEIDRVWLFDRPNHLDQVTAGRIEFGDGSTVELTEPLPDGATRGVELRFPARSVEWLRFTVTGAKEGSPNIGLSELAVFASPPRAGRSEQDVEADLEIAHVRCQILLAAARDAKEERRKLELYEEAFAAYDRFLSRTPHGPVGPRAKSEYLDACLAYVRLAELVLGVAAEEEAEELRYRLRGVLEKGLELTSYMRMQVVEAPSRREGIVARARRMHQRAEMLITRARLSPREDLGLLEEAEWILQEFGDEIGGTPTWSWAEQCYEEAEYAEARKWYLRVHPWEDCFEPARTKAALCLYKLADVQGAKEELLRYLEEYVTHPAAAVDTPARKEARQKAMAQATFYLGRIAYAEDDHERVVELYTGYDERFPDQKSYAANALYLLFQAHLTLEHYDEAEAALALVRERRFPTSIGTSSPASLEGAKTEVYKTVGDVELAIHWFEPRFAGFGPPSCALELPEHPPRSAIVFFFGGGWNGGSVLQFVPLCRALTGMGTVAMVADYRVKSRHGTTPFECVEDGKSAVRWIRANAERLNVDPDRIAAGGGSAGGHVAAATATVVGLEAEGEDLSISSVPNALVLFNPVYDNGPDGYGHDRVKERWGEISPLHNIREGMPPTIVFLGTEDKLIPVATAEAFRERMRAVGSRSELRLYKGQGHGFFNSPAYREGASELLYWLTMAETQRFLASIGFR